MWLRRAKRVSGDYFEPNHPVAPTGLNLGVIKGGQRRSQE